MTDDDTNVVHLGDIRFAKDEARNHEIRQAVVRQGIDIYKQLSKLIEDTGVPGTAARALGIALADLADELKTRADDHGNNTAASVLSILEARIADIRDERDLPYLGPRGRKLMTMVGSPFDQGEI